jgi:hypothetical protein
MATKVHGISPVNLPQPFSMPQAPNRLATLNFLQFSSQPARGDLP